MNSSETAVAEDADDFPALGILGQVTYDRIRIGKIRRFLARSFEVLHQASRVEAFFWCEQFQSSDLRYNNSIGIGERGG